MRQLRLYVPFPLLPWGKLRRRIRNFLVRDAAKYVRDAIQAGVIAGESAGGNDTVDMRMKLEFKLAPLTHPPMRASVTLPTTIGRK